MRPLKFLLAAAGINLALFLMVYLLPNNPLCLAIGYLTSLFVFIFGWGIRLSVLPIDGACILATSGGSLGLYQSFYEFLTIISLTIPLYLKSWKKLAEKTTLMLLVMVGYYVLLYGITIMLLERGHSATLLLSFLNYNTEYFMLPAFLALWLLINRKKISNLVSTWKNEC